MSIKRRIAKRIAKKVARRIIAGKKKRTINKKK